MILIPGFWTWTALTSVAPVPVGTPPYSLTINAPGNELEFTD